jgi:ABC-type dipeptide/oligopeptide/nickel transport system ATPase subunit
MNQTARVFTASPAIRESVPLLIGLMGCSGSGKTFSAHRLATGICQVTGGDIHFIDTEARRALHYADLFKFYHIPFDAPFGSLDYLAAMQQSIKAGAKVIVVDSLSHEHEGPGGMLDYWETEVDRMAGTDYAKRERVKMAALIKPKQARRAMINGLLQLPANFIFCFRAKETVKPVKVGGKTEIVPQGFMPIAGAELVYEMTVNCLLMPRSNGVPTWASDNPGEKAMMKLPEQFKTMFARSEALNEATGKALAEWARGNEPGDAADTLLETAFAVARGGSEAFRQHWLRLDNVARATLTRHMDAIKATATAADKATVGADPETGEIEGTPAAVAKLAAQPEPKIEPEDPFELGMIARVAGKSLHSVPSEIKDDAKATALWKSGWRKKDFKLSEGAQ